VHGLKAEKKSPISAGFDILNGCVALQQRGIPLNDRKGAEHG
jgi:hypothetical protein